MAPRGAAAPELRREDRRVLDRYLAHLRVERGLAPRTIEAYRRDLSRYLEHLAHSGVALAAVGPADVSAWMQALRTGDDTHPALSAPSAARALAAVRGLHGHLDEEGESAAPDPTAALPAPARMQRLPHPISLDEVEALLDAASRPRTGLLPVERALRDRALVEVLYGLGARISEATGLDVDDLDLAERQAVLRGKGDKHRVVPLGRYAIAAVEAYLTRARPVLAARGRGGPALFLGIRGTRLTRQAAWQIIQECAQVAQLDERISPHTLRHSYATHLLHGGADVRAVQELLGHASVTTTQLYTQVTVDSLREAHAASHPRARQAPTGAGGGTGHQH